VIADTCREAITVYLDAGYRLDQVETELIDSLVG
jgi:hypothetical protein